MTQPLSQLNDIHEVTQASWWPLAWGWWLLIAVGVALITAAVVTWLKRKHHQKVLKRCNQQLEKQQSNMGDITTLVKIAALQYLPVQTFEGTQIRTLTGEKWLRMLNSGMPEAQKLSAENISNLQDALYKPANQDMVSMYQDFSLQWLKHACPRRLANV